jgi:hypothetical protein
MNNLTVEIKNKTNLTLNLEKKYNVTYYQKPNLLSKLLLQEKIYPDIYFHKGFLSTEAIDFIENSRIIIVSSQKVREEIMVKVSNIDISKLHVIYPYIKEKKQYEKSIKKNFKKKFNIPKKSKIIFFRGKDLSQCGLTILTDVISRMYNDDFTLIIESSLKQISSLKLQMERSDLKFNYLLLPDYEEVSELFIASDIFILPTSQKYFSTDVLKAMYYRNAVFVMEANPASELIDVFSLIQGEEDRSVSFKVDSLLINKDELKKIQKENEIIAKNYSLEMSFNKILKILDKTFDI